MRDMLFSIIHDLGASRILRRFRVRNREISVLMFHRISDEYDPLWPSVPIKTFRFLMKELSSKAHVVPLENFREIDYYPDRPLVALSFDDGYRDFWENALPALTDFRLPAHHNICPDLIDRGTPPWTQILNSFLQSSGGKSIELPNGKTYKTRNKFKELDFINICNELNTIDDESRNDWINSLLNKIPESKITKLMDWSQIRECTRLGIHIGSHGMGHLNMSRIKNKDILLAATRDSKRKIYKEVGIDPVIFAFPGGLYDSLSMEAVKKSGYKIALLCDDKVAILADSKNKEDFYVFPRINICRVNWKEENLRLLGFHQKIKSWVKKTHYVLQQS